MKQLQKKESASHDVTILMHIPVDQLAALKTTYQFMLEAVSDALKNKIAAEKQTAQIIIMRKTNLRRYERQCLKIAAMMRRDYSIYEISIRFDCDLGGKTLIRRMAARGRAIYRDYIVKARKNYVIQSYHAGLGVRESARTMPTELGACSCSYACKIIKAYNMRHQPQLTFPLASV